MGIRYIAIPVHPLDVAEAQSCPRCYLRMDPFHHGGNCTLEPCLERERPDGLPDYLDLDKSWAELANLFALPEIRKDAAAVLVKGKVEHTGGEWIPYYGVLSPLQVEDSADALTDLAESDIRENIDQISRFREDREQAASIVLHYLDAARAFTRKLAEAGYGLIYIIG